MQNLFVTVACIFCTLLQTTAKTDVDKLRGDFLTFEDDSWSQVLSYRHSNLNPEVSMVKKYQKLNAKVKNLCDFQIDPLRTEWTEIYDNLTRICAGYVNFWKLQGTQNGETTKDALKEMTKIVNHPDNGVAVISRKIRNDIVKRGLFEESRKKIVKDLCIIDQSPHQLLYGIYKTVASVQLVSYAAEQFSWLLNAAYSTDNSTDHSFRKTAQKTYRNNTRDIIKVATAALSLSSRQLWKCNPQKHKEGETYVEITKLLQGYIQNEINLNGDETCKETCEDYKYTRNQGCYQDKYCSKHNPCAGKIVNCKTAGTDMQVYYKDSSTRRYEYIEYSNGAVLGRKQRQRTRKSHVVSYWSWLPNVSYRCNYCFCLCDQKPWSDRYINLRAAISNVEANRVVTGLRFVKVNRVIHLQIQEGKLLPYGAIDPETVGWVPVDNYTLLDRGVYEIQDYHTLTFERRAIDLDDVETEDGRVVTGVRFKTIGTHLNFEIFTTPFDFVSGQLNDPVNRSGYKSNDNSTSRTRVRLVRPDVPTRSNLQARPDSSSNQYLEFTNTDMELDAAQTTVPFFDAQKVESSPPVPLKGAGIYHKGREHSSGFVAPKIITYDFTQHLQSAFPEED